MDKSQDVAVTIGSLRKDSTNRKVANALADVAPAELKLSIMEIGHLPIYHQDGDQNPPVAWKEFRGRIKATDAVLFVTPELNRSVPAALKNASASGLAPTARACGMASPVRSSARRRVDGKLVKDPHRQRRADIELIQFGRKGFAS